MRARQLGFAKPIFYGWVIVAALSVTEVVSWGILYYAFTVFLKPMQTDLGWSQLTVSGAYSLALLTAGIAAVPVGRWIDRHGGRALMTAGSCLAAVLVAAWSQVTNVWAFYAIMAGIGVAMAMVLYEPAFAIIATWFRAQRARAFTVLTFFGAWASAVFIPLSPWLVGQLGWRPALLVLAGMLAGVTVPLHALAIRRRPHDMGLLPDGAAAVSEPSVPAVPAERSLPTGAALRDAGFWWLSLALTMSTIATVSLTVYLIPYLTSHNHSTSFAATVAGLFGLMSLAGRLAIGPLVGRCAYRWIGGGLVGMQLAGLAVLLVSPTAPGALIAVTLFGAGAGTLTIVRAALLAERYGPLHYGSISGLLSLLLTGARALAPVAAAALIALSGGYGTLLWVLIVLLAAGTLALVQVDDWLRSRSPRGRVQSRKQTGR